MAELKTKATKSSVKAFLGAIEDEDRRRECEEIVSMMTKATKAKPVMWGPAIVGFGAACELASRRMEAVAQRTRDLRDRAESGAIALGARIFGRGAERISNTTYFAFPDIDGETLVIELDKAGFAVASGAACSSTSTEPSATLLAMGVAPEMARGAVRISFGVQNNAAEVDIFLHALGESVSRLRRLTAIAV